MRESEKLPGALESERVLQALIADEVTDDIVATDVSEPVRQMRFLFLLEPLPRFRFLFTTLPSALDGAGEFSGTGGTGENVDKFRPG